MLSFGWQSHWGQRCWILGHWHRWQRRVGGATHCLPAAPEPAAYTAPLVPCVSDRTTRRGRTKPSGHWPPEHVRWKITTQLAIIISYFSDTKIAGSDFLHTNIAKWATHLIKSRGKKTDDKNLKRKKVTVEVYSCSDGSPKQSVNTLFHRIPRMS